MNMVLNIYVKTNRTQKGYAKAELHRFMNYSDGKVCYSFKFYKTYKFFDTYKELRDFVESNYELLIYKVCQGMVEYHLPENRNDFFRYQDGKQYETSQISRYLI